MISRAASSRLRDLVRAELDAAGITQTHVAQTLGFSEKHISQVLVGRSGITVDLADAILGVAGRELRFAAELINDGGAA